MDVEEAEQEELKVVIKPSIAKKIYASYEMQGFENAHAMVNWLVAQAFLPRQ